VTVAHPWSLDHGFPDTAILFIHTILATMCVHPIKMSKSCLHALSPHHVHNLQVPYTRETVLIPIRQEA